MDSYANGDSDSPQRTLQDQLDKKPGESKKYGMTKFGVYTILAVFVICATLFMIKPDTAGHIVVLSQIVVTSIAGLIGIFCGAQATVDFRNSSSLAAVVESKKSESKIDISEKIEVIRAPGAKHFDGDDIP